MKSEYTQEDVKDVVKYLQEKAFRSCAYYIFK